MSLSRDRSASYFLKVREKDRRTPIGHRTLFETGGSDLNMSVGVIETPLSGVFGFRIIHVDFFSNLL